MGTGNPALPQEASNHCQPSINPAWEKPSKRRKPLTYKIPYSKPLVLLNMFAILSTDEISESKSSNSAPPSSSTAMTSSSMEPPEQIFEPSSLMEPSNQVYKSSSSMESNGQGNTLSSLMEPPKQKNVSSSLKEPPNQINMTSSSKEPPSQVNAPSSSKEPPSQINVLSSSKEPPKQKNVSSSSKEPPDQVNATSSLMEPSRQVNLSSSSKEPLSQVNVLSSSKEPPTQVNLSSSSKEPPGMVSKLSSSTEMLNQVKKLSSSTEPLNHVNKPSSSTEPSKDTNKTQSKDRNKQKQDKQTKKQTLTHLLTNADVLTNKMNELRFNVQTHDPDTISVSEVLPKNFKEKIYPNDFHLEGYDMIHHPNVEKNIGRGSIMYIKDTLTHMPVDITGPGKDFEEFIIQEIKTDDNYSFNLLHMYRRGASDTSNNENLLHLLKEVSNLKPTMISMGDINLSDLDWEHMTAPGDNIRDYNHRFIECVRDLFLTQHVDENTRQRGGNEPSLLDVILTNDENYVSRVEYLAPLGKSDHSIIKFVTPFAPPKPQTKIKVMYDKGDYEAFDNYISCVDWRNEFEKFPTDVNSQWKYFKGIYLEAEQKFIPRKKVFINGKISKKLSTRFDKKTLRAMKKKNHLWSKIRKNLASEEENLQFRRLRNQVKSLTRKAKKLFEKKIAKNVKQNPKAFWAYTQSKLKYKSTIPDLMIPGSEQNPVYAKKDPDKAEVFVNYFSSVFTSEPDNDTMPPFDERKYEKALENIDITQELVMKKLEKLKINKSPGPDTIHPRVLNGAAKSLSVPITYIFKTSLQTKTLPDEWKHANISAIFKKGKKTLPSNYRPVSLTCVVCKIMESIIRDAIIDHMTENSLFSPYQFGFISGRSTVLQLLQVLKIWTDILDEGGLIDSIYCDFMKAFDKVPHKRLIYKVSKYGIKGNILGWISSFLNERTQCVNMNGSISASAPVTSGIPQGSVLGPILFVIYINDLPEVIDKDSLAFLFADDTKLFREIKSEHDIKTLQNDINEVVKWSNIWLLKFHPDKCKHMGIAINKSTQLAHHYNMDGHLLEKSKCEKDIGVYIDEKLNFKQHINNAVNKANRVLGVARRTFDTLDHSSFTFIFKGLVRPHLEYGAPVWSPHHLNLINTIENVQRRATKLLPGMRDLDYDERLRTLKLPTLAYRRVRGDMIQVFKMLMPLEKGAYDKSIPNPLKLKSELGIRLDPKGHDYQLYKGQVEKDIALYAFSYRVCKLWNSLPKSLIHAKTVKAFEIGLDRHWANQPLMYDNHEASIIV